MPEFFAWSKHHPGLTVEALERRVLARGGCFNSIQVRWQRLLVLQGGKLTLSHVIAPDAESVRIALRNSGFTINSLWPAKPMNSSPFDYNAPTQSTNALLIYQGSTAVTDNDIYECRRLIDLHNNTQGEISGLGYRSTDESKALFLLNCDKLSLMQSLLGDALKHACWQIARCDFVSTCQKPGAGHRQSA